ncbi:MAG: hypothetical protein HUK24_01180 [Sphaerochaetaceae bacterium]|nr:hypothetical protein [Sphaerochaetaceae bacterium]
MIDDKLLSNVIFPCSYWIVGLIVSMVVNYFFGINSNFLKHSLKLLDKLKKYFDKLDKEKNTSTIIKILNKIHRLNKKTNKFLSVYLFEYKNKKLIGKAKEEINDNEALLNSAVNTILEGKPFPKITLRKMRNNIEQCKEDINLTITINKKKEVIRK